MDFFNEYRVTKFIVGHIKLGIQKLYIMVFIENLIKHFPI